MGSSSSPGPGTWADIAGEGTQDSPVAGFGFSAAPYRPAKSGFDSNLVRKDFLGTIYFNASANGSFGFVNPRAAFRWCLDQIKSDLEKNRAAHSDTASTLSLDKPVTDLGEVPKSVFNIIDQFLTYLKTEELGAPGFVRYVIFNETQVMVKYHWSRGYIRNPKNIMSSGMRERRFAITSPRYDSEDGKSYEIEISVVCT